MGDIDFFFNDAWKRSDGRNMKWYQENLMSTLQAAKKKRSRDIDKSIELAQKLLKIYNEPIPIASPTPPFEFRLYEDANFMRPVEADVLNILYGSTEKGAAEKYLNARYKKRPEDRFNCRLCSSWDYGWLARSSAAPRRGRCAVIRDTFYRGHNAEPDPLHYAHPLAGDVSICGQNACKF